MSMKDSDIKTPVEEEKINRKYQTLLANHKKSEAHPAKNVMGEQPHVAPNNSGRTAEGPFGGSMMNWSNLLVYLEEALDAMETLSAEDEADVGMAPVGMPPASGDNSDLLERLNKLFTPVLVMQGFENDMADKLQESFSEAAVLTEQNVFKFDDQTRMAQLISVCALLIAQKKQSEMYKIFEKSSALARQSKLNIQREEYDEAKALAQQFLVMVSTTNNSPVARKAATDMLPATQH